MSSKAWETWPFTNPDPLDELGDRMKLEARLAEKRDPKTYMLRIGPLQLSWGHGHIELKRFIGPDHWQNRHVYRCELDTRAWESWGSYEDVVFSLEMFRQRQVLDDLAKA